MPATTNGHRSDSATDAVREMVSDTAAQIKEQGGQTAGTVADKALSVADDRKGQLTERAQSTLDSVHRIIDDMSGEGMERPAQMLTQVIDSAERVLDSIDSRDSQQLLRDGGQMIRQQPLVFAGVLFGLGFAAARLLSASMPTQPTTGQYNNSEPDWPTLNNPAPYARDPQVTLAGSPYAGQS